MFVNKFGATPAGNVGLIWPDPDKQLLWLYHAIPAAIIKMCPDVVNQHLGPSLPLMRYPTNDCILMICGDLPSKRQEHGGEELQNVPSIHSCLSKRTI